MVDEGDWERFKELLERGKDIKETHHDFVDLMLTLLNEHISCRVKNNSTDRIDEELFTHLYAVADEKWRERFEKAKTGFDFCEDLDRGTVLKQKFDEGRVYDEHITSKTQGVLSADYERIRDLTADAGNQPIPVSLVDMKKNRCEGNPDKYLDKVIGALGFHTCFYIRFPKPEKRMGDTLYLTGDEEDYGWYYREGIDGLKKCSLHNTTFRINVPNMGVRGKTFEIITPIPKTKTLKYCGSLKQIIGQKLRNKKDVYNAMYRVSLDYMRERGWLDKRFFGADFK